MVEEVDNRYTRVRIKKGKKRRSKKFFFFQAEDGIQDLVRSRGLGDVYKSQTLSYSSTFNVRRTVYKDF